MSVGQDARLFDLGYRAYDGPRERPARAILTLALFTMRRVLGLGRGGRHKVLPAITLAIAYLPALTSVAFSVLANNIVATDLITYGDYMFIIGSALALFAALVAPEALCPDRRSGMLGLYLAGPLDRNRYLLAKGLGVLAVMLLITVGPLLFMLAANVIAGFGPSAGETPKLLLRIAAAGLVTALLYTSLSMAVSSFTTRRAAAAVAVVLLLLVPASVVRPAIDAGAPNALDLLSFPFVVFDLSYRIFGEQPGDDAPVRELATWVVAAGVGAAIAAGALVCWIRYRRIEAFR
ncbi:MAG TPA: ABC transporter permease subunit [Gaiellaceae bacterium]|nr:ABC transporter permease subunit [Gaiellaceae bacterium]